MAMAMTMRMVEVRKKPCCMSSQVKWGWDEKRQGNIRAHSRDARPAGTRYGSIESNHVQLQPNINDSRLKITAWLDNPKRVCRNLTMDAFGRWNTWYYSQSAGSDRKELQ